MTPDETAASPGGDEAAAAPPPEPVPPLGPSAPLGSPAPHGPPAPPGPGWWMASDGRWYPPSAWPPYPVMPFPAGPPGPPGGLPGAATGPGANGLSIASLVLGIFPVIPVLGSVAAIILGAVGRVQVRRAQGRQTGKGMALAGILLGSTWLAGITAIIVLAAVFAHGTSPNAGVALPAASPGATPLGATCSTAVPTRGPTFHSATPPPFVLRPGTNYSALVVTSCGSFTIALDPTGAPNAVNSFVYLAQQGFYDGLTFHRIVHDFAIQGGDPAGDGRGGPGYEVVDPVPAGTTYSPGTVAMANAGTAGGAGSQFFVVPDVPGVASDYQPLYAVVGVVTSGLDTTVAALNDVRTVVSSYGEQSQPSPAVYIISITISSS